MLLLINFVAVHYSWAELYIAMSILHRLAAGRLLLVRLFLLFKQG